MHETTFLGAIRSFLTKWLDFEGRATRFEFNCAFWGFQFLYGFSLLIAILFGALLFKGLSALGVLFFASCGIAVIGVSLWTFVAYVSLTWRRLIDMGQNPLLGLLWFVPFVNIALLVMLCAMPTKPENSRPAEETSDLIDKDEPVGGSD